MTVSFSWTT